MVLLKPITIIMTSVTVVIFIIIVLYLLSLTITSIPYTVFIINKMRNNKNQFPRKEILLCKNVYKKIITLYKNHRCHHHHHHVAAVTEMSRTLRN